MPSDYGGDVLHLARHLMCGSLGLGAGRSTGFRNSRRLGLARSFSQPAAHLEVDVTGMAIGAELQRESD